jgi:hypothetical protein
MPININLKGVKTDEFAPLPKGRYKVSVYDCKPGRSKNNNPKLTMEFRVLEPEDMKGRRVWAEVSLLETALFTLKRYLIATGYTEEQLAGNVEFEPSDQLGKELVVQIGHREYNGEMRQEITRWYTKDTPTGIEDNLEFATASLPEPGSDSL